MYRVSLRNVAHILAIDYVIYLKVMLLGCICPYAVCVYFIYLFIFICLYVCSFNYLSSYPYTRTVSLYIYVYLLLCNLM